MERGGLGGARRLGRLGLAVVLLAAAGAAAAPAASLDPGKLLVASRSLRDPNFRETVVLIVEHTPLTGTLGLVINRPSGTELASVLPDLEGDPERLAETVYIGGPVEPTRFTLLIRSPAEPEGADHVFADVFASGSRSVLERLVAARSPADPFRVFAGHAGWAPGQLEAELAVGGWHVVDGRSAIVFDHPPEKVWPRLILVGTADLARRGEPEIRPRLERTAAD